MNKSLCQPMFEANTQLEQAKCAIDLIVRVPIGSTEFAMGIATLLHAVDMSKGRSDGTINEAMWNKLSTFLQECRAMLNALRAIKMTPFERMKE